MKLYKISFALLLGMSLLTSCGDKLELTNPNLQTTGSFGNTTDDLEECVIACYHNLRMEGTYARVGYAHDAMRGDEVWNCTQRWFQAMDNLNAPATDDVSCSWIWRDWYQVLNISNYVISRLEKGSLTDQEKRIKGQALFTRALTFYNLACYYQNPGIILDYDTYSTLEGLYVSNHEEGDQDAFAQYDRVMDQAEKDFKEALELLPTKDLGGEWAKGRATKGSAAGFYARTLMQRHKYSEALTILKSIINGEYGSYKLMANFGDNFRETSAYENNDESLFEIQFLDYGTGGTDHEWTPVNISKNATQGQAIETVSCPEDNGGWHDMAASPWLYQLFKGERTKNGSLDPRLYWTIGTYEPEWEDFEFGNMCYQQKMTADNPVVTSNENGGLPIAKWTNMRTGLYSSIVVGLTGGINLRLMRYSDVLLRAAECENEISGPTQQAIDWINQVRRRANLNDLRLSDFNSADKLFEQIANVERPKEFGCEFGRGFDLLRWGFFYRSDRLQQLKEHGTYRLTADKTKVKDPVSYSATTSDKFTKSSFDTFVPGHEYLPIYQNNLNVNPNLVGNSANNNSDNSTYFTKNGWTIHPVVNL